MVTAIRGLLKKERAVKEGEKRETDKCTVEEKTESKADEVCDSESNETVKIK